MTAFEKILSRKWTFLALFTLIYFLSLLTLSTVGLAPWSSEGPSVVPRMPHGGPAVAVEEGETPVRIEIPKIGIRTSVSNPSSANVSVLDAELTKGAVRYPGSGTPGENGNVLIFGHSSHLPVVHNEAYRAFNDIQNLEAGDPIFVIGTDRVFIYSVETVKEVNASTDAISLDVEGAKLTLATCNNFGSKEDRFVVTATLVGIEEL